MTRLHQRITRSRNKGRAESEKLYAESVEMRIRMEHRFADVRKAFRISIMIFIAIFAISPLSGQNPETSVPESEKDELSAQAIVAASFPIISVDLSAVPVFARETAAIMPWICYPVLLGTHVPLYFLDPGIAFGYTIAGLALPGAGVGLMFAKDSFPLAQPFSDVFLKSYKNLMLYSAYDTYRLTRKSRGGSSLLDLALAPFIPENLSSPLVWIPSVLAPAALIGYHLAFEADRFKPVYETGVSYAGSMQVSPFVGGISAAGFGAAGMLAISVGEESFFRGVVYEGFKNAIGVVSGRVIDMLFFPAIHASADIQAGLRSETILLNFAWRSIMTLVLDITYDDAGLSAAVATHFWSDFILVMARWVFYGG